MPITKVSLQSLAETRVLAQVIAELVRQGDMIALNGGLASGKTTFVQELLSSLGTSELVTSPTYALVHVYQSRLCRVFHVDAYRLKDFAEFRDLGLEDYAEDSVTIVEWAERIEGYVPFDLRLTFEVEEAGSEARLITIDADGIRWQPLHDRFLQSRA